MSSIQSNGNLKKIEKFFKHFEIKNEITLLAENQKYFQITLTKKEFEKLKEKESAM